MIHPRDEKPFFVAPPGALEDMKAKGIDPDVPVYPEETSPVSENDPRDAEHGEELRDEAIERVTKNASPAWVEAAFEAIKTICSDLSRTQMTTDDVWTLLAARNVEPPHERRAMTVPMHRAKKAGWIVKTNDFIQSAIPEGHKRNTQVWRIDLRP